MQAETRKLQETRRLRMYTRNLRGLLEARGYDIPDDFELSRMDEWTFTRPVPHFPVSEIESEAETIDKARKLMKKGAKKFDVLKVILYDDTGSAPSLSDIRQMFERATTQDVLGRGYVLVLWQSSEARRKLKAYRTGISPRILIENPDIICTGLQLANVYFSKIREVVSPLVSDAETLAMVSRESANFPKTNSDDVTSVFYGLVPGDVYRIDDVGPHAVGTHIEFRVVVQNIQ